MKQKSENHPLKAQKMPLTLVDKKFSQKSFIKKQKNNHKSKDKLQTRPNITYFNFFTSKNKRNNKKQLKPQRKLTQRESLKFKEEFEKHAIQQEANSSYSQIGSEYGDYNYDKQLKNFISKKGLRSRQNDFSQKTNKNFISGNQNKTDCNFRKFEKFRTETQSKNQSNSKNSLNSMHQIKFNQNQNLPKSNNQFDMKFYLQKYKEEQNNHTQDPDKKFESKNTDKKFIHFQVFQSKRVHGNENYEVNISKHFTKKHHRSKTQQEIQNSNIQKSQPIFQKYSKLKDQFRKASSITNRHLSNKTRAKQLRIQKQRMVTHENQKQSQSYKKYESVPIFQSVLKMGNSKSGICFSPQNDIKDNIEQITLRKLIKARQKDFFKKVSNHGIQTNAFTFEQIKSKIQKIQKIQSRKKSIMSFQPLKLDEVSSPRKREQYIYSVNDRINLGEMTERQKDMVIKYNGINFKAKLMKKHTQFYAKFKNKTTMQGYLMQRTSSKKFKPQLIQ